MLILHYKETSEKNRTEQNKTEKGCCRVEPLLVGPFNGRRRGETYTYFGRVTTSQAY